MKYQVTQKKLALGDDFSIKDQSGREIYYVDGKAMSIGKKLNVLDGQKNKVARINKRLFTFNPTFEITRNGQTAVFKKKRFTLKTTCILDVPGPNDYSIVGDLVGNEFTITRNNQKVARIEKKFLTTGDSYSVDIRGGSKLLILCVAVIIDLVLYPGR